MESHIKQNMRGRRGNLFIGPAALAALTVAIGWLLYQAFLAPHMIARAHGSRMVALVWGQGQVYVQYHHVKAPGAVLVSPRLAGSTVWFLDRSHRLAGQDGGLIVNPLKTRFRVGQVGNVVPGPGSTGELSLPMGFLLQYGNGNGAEYLMAAYEVGFEGLGHEIVHAQAPLWFPAFLLSAGLLYFTGAAGRARRRRRVKQGHCPVCDYDLRASPGRCPECGAAVAGESPARSVDDKRMGTQS